MPVSVERRVVSEAQRAADYAAAVAESDRKLASIEAKRAADLAAAQSESDRKVAQIEAAAAISAVRARPPVLPSLSLGAPLLREIQRGPRAGESVPQHEVFLPGWQDIIHLVPTALQSDQERAATRKETIRRIQASPSPDIASQFGQLATQIDNIQDALVGLSVLGRVVVSTTGRVIPGLRSLSSLTDVLSAINIFYPPIPGIQKLPSLGEARLALRRFGAIGELELRGQVQHLTLAGKRVRRWASSTRTKRLMQLLGKLGTGTYARRLEETIKTGKVGFGWGEAAQIVQVTDQVYGMGVSLGPIFGAMQDTFFGLLRGARFDLSGPVKLGIEALASVESVLLYPFLPGVPTIREIPEIVKPIKVTVDWPGVLPLLDELLLDKPGRTERDIASVLGPLLERVSPYVGGPAKALADYERTAIDLLTGKPEKFVRGVESLLRPVFPSVDLEALREVGAWETFTGIGLNAAKKVFDASKWIVGLRGVLTWEQHIEILAAQFLALQTIRPFLQQADWGELARPLLEKRGSLDPVPFVDRDSTGLPGALSAALRDGPAKFPLEWLEEAPTPEAEVFGRSLVSSFADLLFDCLEGPGPHVEERSPDFIRAAVLIHDYDLLPPFDRTDSQLREYLDLVTQDMAMSDRGFPPLSDIREIWIHSFPGGEIS